MVKAHFDSAPRLLQNESTRRQFQTRHTVFERTGLCYDVNVYIWKDGEKKTWTVDDTQHHAAFLFPEVFHIHYNTSLQ